MKLIKSMREAVAKKAQAAARGHVEAAYQALLRQPTKDTLDVYHKALAKLRTAGQGPGLDGRVLRRAALQNSKRGLDSGSG